jgi:hypothetical protein
MDTKSDVTITITSSWSPDSSRFAGPRRMWDHEVKWGDEVHKNDGALASDVISAAFDATRRYEKLVELAERKRVKASA